MRCNASFTALLSVLLLPSPLNPRAALLPLFPASAPLSAMLRLSRSATALAMRPALTSSAIGAVASARSAVASAASASAYAPAPLGSSLFVRRVSFVAANDPTAAPALPVPFDYKVGETSGPQPGVDRNIWPKSASMLVLEALKTGPKTRLQLFFAINKGPLAPAAVMPKPQPKKINLITQHGPAPLTAIDVARLKAERLKAEGSAAVEAEPRRYPTGQLRNPTHLTKVLHTLQHTGQIWAKPYSSVQQRMSDAERAATKAIVDAAGESSAVIVASMGETAAADIGTAHLSEGAKKKLMAAGVRHDQWVYVSRAWAAPPKPVVGDPAKRLAIQQKNLERRVARQFERQETAVLSGKPLLLGRDPRVSRRVERKRRLEAKAAEKLARTQKSLEKFQKYTAAGAIPNRDGQLPFKSPSMIIAKQNLAAARIVAEKKAADAANPKRVLREKKRQFFDYVFHSKEQLTAKAQKEGKSYEAYMAENKDSIHKKWANKAEELGLNQAEQEAISTYAVNEKGAQ